MLTSSYICGQGWLNFWSSWLYLCSLIITDVYCLVYVRAGDRSRAFYMQDKHSPSWATSPAAANMCFKVLLSYTIEKFGIEWIFLLSLSLYCQEFYQGWKLLCVPPGNKNTHLHPIFFFQCFFQERPFGSVVWISHLLYSVRCILPLDTERKRMIYPSLQKARWHLPLSKKARSTSLWLTLQCDMTLKAFSNYSPFLEHGSLLGK